MGTVRIDKYLWSIRIFKTRSQASSACRSGKVVIDDIQVKPSREVKIEDTIYVKTGPLTKVLKVKDLLERRVSAKIAQDYYEDLTPEEEIEKVKMLREVNYEKRDRGVGRPTKKERRLIEKLKKKKHF
jgi:ribosome-associated heat shock protein Hsp15